MINKGGESYVQNFACSSFYDVWKGDEEEDEVDDEIKELLDALEEQDIKYLTEKRKKHKGEWITQKAVDEYRARALCLWQNENQDVGERRALRIELEEWYGLTELEAVNILNGKYTPDILRKYERIQKLIPLKRSRLIIE